MQMSHDEKELFFEKNKKLAYWATKKFVTTKTTFIDKEDIKQQALMFLWEAIDCFDENKGAFSTFASIHIYNKMINYLQYINNGNLENHINVEVCSSDESYNSVEALPANNERENNISYNLLVWDIELQLLKMKNNRRNNSTINTGIEIVKKILKHDSPSQIQEDLHLNRNNYNYCLAKVRGQLKALIN